MYIPVRIDIILYTYYTYLGYIIMRVSSVRMYSARKRRTE